MKIIVTTSNKYLHILPVFCHLFNKYWSKHQPVTIVGYEPPNKTLPDNFTFVSLGKQGDVKEFSTDLAKYFFSQDERFVWLMEDTFLTDHVDLHRLNFLYKLAEMHTGRGVGRINLTTEGIKQDHQLYRNIDGIDVFENTQIAKYRLSTQPSIWNRNFLLQYMTPGLSPWDFETQKSINDGWQIFGLDQSTVKHNEGVRRHDIHKLNLEGIDQQTISEMNELKII